MALAEELELTEEEVDVLQQDGQAEADNYRRKEMAQLMILRVAYYRWRNLPNEQNTEALKNAKTEATEACGEKKVAQTIEAASKLIRREQQRLRGAVY